jgi:hypothetical protein
MVKDADRGWGTDPDADDEGLETDLSSELLGEDDLEDE